MRRVNGAGRHDIARVPDPVGGFPGDIPTSIHNTRRDLTPVAVVDVYDQQRRVRALARIDLLDRLRRTRVIDEASYLVGREIEKLFEPMAYISGGAQWLEGDRVDAATQAELATVLGVDRAMRVNAMLAWIARHCGRQDARLIWLVLGEQLSFATVAAAFGRKGVRGVRYLTDRFADALLTLADAKAARGRALRQSLPKR